MNIAKDVEISRELQRQLDRQFASLALARPDLYNTQEVSKRLAKAFNQDESVLNTRPQPQNLPQEGVPGGNVLNALEQGQTPTIAGKSERI